MDLLGAAMSPLPGGHSGETFLAEVAGERSVVRVYGPRSQWRGPQAAEVDAAVLRLVRGLLPVPEVLEVRRADPAAGTPGLLVTSHLPGERLDLLLPEMAREERVGVARRLGEILGRLSQMPTLRPGMFADGDLRVGPMPSEAADHAAWVEAHAEQGALATWSPEERKGLAALADRAQGLLEDVERSCVVHSDFNPKNLLVDPVTWEVTGVLDWEYCHSGSPFTDLGNLLRFEREPAFAGAVLEEYADRVPGVDGVDDLLERARHADLFGLVGLASRRGENPVADRAHELLRVMARAGSVHAEPVG
jgi:aminoglycoside phosphotransferase (APT) family kinase protein